MDGNALSYNEMPTVVIVFYDDIRRTGKFRTHVVSPCSQHSQQPTFCCSNVADIEGIGKKLGIPQDRFPKTKFLCFRTFYMSSFLRLQYGLLLQNDS